MKKAIKMMTFVLIMSLVITSIMPLSVHAESGPAEEIFDDSTDEHIIIYHNEDGSETIVNDPIVDYYEYEEDGYRYTTIIYESGATSTECELISAYSDDDVLVSTNTYIEDCCLCTEYYYSSGRYELVVEDLDSLDTAPGEEFGDDGSHTIIYHLPNGEEYAVDDPIVSEETYVVDGIEYTDIEYESGATLTMQRDLEAYQDDEEVFSDQMPEEENFYDDEGYEYGCDEEYYIDDDDYYDYDEDDEDEDEDEDEDDDYEDRIYGLRNMGASDERDQEDYFWSYDSSAKKLVIAANNSNILNYTKDGSSFPWYEYKDKIELVAITGIESICANVFKNYPKLKKVYTNGDLEYMSTYAFLGCDNLSWIYINSYKCELDVDSWTNLKKMNTTYDSNHAFSNFKVSCHYDTSTSSIYSKCMNSGITCETIEKQETKNNFLTDVSNGIKNLYNTIVSGFGGNSKETKDDAQKENTSSSTRSTSDIVDEIFVYQMNDNIKRLNDGNRTWGNSACVVCTVSMMIERYAAYDGYNLEKESNKNGKRNGVFYYSTGNMNLSDDELELVKDLTKNETTCNGELSVDVNYEKLFSKSEYGWGFNYDSSITVKEFSDMNGNPLNLGLTKLRSISDEDLQEIVKKHPEGVDAHVRGYGRSEEHSVLVLGYNEYTQKYTILDTGALNPNSDMRRTGTNGKYEVPFEFLSNSYNTKSVDAYYITNSYY